MRNNKLYLSIFNFLFLRNFMKKLLLSAASMLMLSSTAFAVRENTFYLKVNIGANKMDSVKTKAYYSGPSLKLKSKAIPVIDFGVGYYIMDNLRTDITLGFAFNPEQKKNGVIDLTDKETATLKSKANITTLMLNSYADMFATPITRIFIGAGVGVSRIKETLYWSDSKLPSGRVSRQNTSVSSKNKTNVAYQLTIGASAKVAPSVNAELAYKWMDYGKSKFKDGVTASRFKGHHIIAGIRFDF
jgi:opacity protein-like surface antigen